MRHMLQVGLAAVVMLLATKTVEAGAPAPPPSIPDLLVLVDCAIVGQVVDIEAKTVKAPRFPGDKEPGEFHIAVVKVSEIIRGPKGMTHIKVGFLPPPPPPPPGTFGSRRRTGVQLQKGQEACLFLTRHPTENFHLAPNYYNVVDKKTPQFKQTVSLAQRSARLLLDPLAGLKAKDPLDRLTTVALLLAEYRRPRGPVRGQEPIPIEESKLILKALAEFDWNNQAFAQTLMHPQRLFYQLGLTEKDGWKQPTDFRQFPTVAKKWLNEHAESYRIQRFVTAQPKQ